MNRKELIKELANKSNLTQSNVDVLLNSLIEVITNELTAGRSLTIRDLGKFKLSKRKSRNGINPRTGESLIIPAMNVATFSAGSKLKALVKYV